MRTYHKQSKATQQATAASSSCEYAGPALRNQRCRSYSEMTVLTSAMRNTAHFPKKLRQTVVAMMALSNLQQR